MHRPFCVARIAFLLCLTALAAAGPLAAQTTINQFSLGADIQPLEITKGPDGNLWYTVFGDETAGSSKVGRITPAGTITEFVLPNTSRPVGIVTGPDGAVWFTESANGASFSSIGRINPATFPAAGSVTHFTAGLNPASHPFGICVGPDGNLWFAERNANAIGRITTAGVITEFPIGSPATTPLGIVSGPDGNLWFSGRDPVNSQIGVMSIAGAVLKRINTPTLLGNPTGITVGPDGRIWFVEFDGNKVGVMSTSATSPSDITEYTTPTPTPYRIVTGPDGALWFTENNGTSGNKIGRITTSGAITEYTAIGLGGPYGIAVGPDRAIWFTARDNTPTKIGQLLVDCVVTLPVVTGGGTLCEGSTLTLTASAGWASYQWYRNGTAIGGATAATFTKTAVAGDTGSYTVTGTNGACVSNPSAPVSVTVAAQPAATAGGPQTICTLGTTTGLGGNTPSGGAGAWSVVSGGTGTFSPSAATPNATFTHTGGAGPILLAWTITNPPCAPSSANVTITLGGSQTVTITAPSGLCPGAPATASVPDGGAGSTYTWTVTNGSIVSGQGTRTLAFTAGTSGSVKVDIAEARTGCTSTGTVTIPITAGCAGPLGFTPVLPCRRIDTRLAADGPQLAAGEQRTFVLVNAPCTIPATAKAVSVNVTVTAAAAAGDLRFFATGTALPPSTTINFGRAQTRANNAIFGLSSDGTGRVDVKNDAAGAVHVIIDVNGYFR